MAGKDGDLMNVLEWLTSADNWSGSDGIPAQVGYHLLYSAIALIVALLIAVPLGIYIGYTGRGERVVAGLANAFRALPTLGLMVFLFLLLSPVIAGNLVYLVPVIIVLVLLAVPPILTGTYSGIQNADPDAVGAARGMGYTKVQILRHVQLPCGLPLLLSGIRSATLQIVSTATVAAFLGLRGLGRFIIDGRAQGDFSQMAGGAIVVAVLALALEIGFVVLARFAISPGLSRRAAVVRTKGKTPTPSTAAISVT